MIPGKPLSKELRDRVRRDYLIGDYTKDELAKKYKVHPNTIFNLARRESWQELKELLGLQTYLYSLGEQLCRHIRRNVATSSPVSERDKEDTSSSEDDTLTWPF